MFLWILLVVNLVTFMSFMYNSTNVDYFKEIYQFFWGCVLEILCQFFGGWSVRQGIYLVFGVRRWGRVYVYAEFKCIPLGPLLGLLVAPGSTTLLTDYLFTGKPLRRSEPAQENWFKSNYMYKAFGLLGRLYFQAHLSVMSS